MASTAVFSALPENTFANWKNKGVSYFLADVEEQKVVLPPDKTIPLDWPFSEVPVDGVVSLMWQKIESANGPMLLRLTSATDVREECSIEARLTKSGISLGVFDVRFSPYYQPFELPILAKDLKLVLNEGITLKMIKGTQPFWFFSASTKQNVIPEAFLPHLVSTKNPDPNAWKDRLESMAAVQSFGWMQGINLDALQDMSVKSAKAKQTLNQLLAIYFANGQFVYDGLRHTRFENKVQGVEFLLPFSILAQQDPTHPALKTAVNFCKEHANESGVIADGKGNDRPIKTEECYTVSYPLAVLAKVFNEPELLKLATVNLTRRMQLLTTKTSVFQRTTEQTEPVFENWARGVTWYMLGLARTLPFLPDNAETDLLKKEFVRVSEWAVDFQQKEGLWTCFLHQPKTGIDTSGSAGISAALMLGIRNGMLPKTLQKAADKSWSGLQTYLTPDGFLKGSAQVNKGGETLQRSGFRVISPYTLGFWE